MPAPLNPIIFVLFILYNLIDLLVLALSSQWRCSNKQCRFFNPKSIIKDSIGGLMKLLKIQYVDLNEKQEALESY